MAAVQRLPRRLFKVEPQKLADETGLALQACHDPPGTSKWIGLPAHPAGHAPVFRRRAILTAPFGVGRQALHVMVGAGPPSTTCGAGPDKAVDGRPAPTMTEYAGDSPTGAVIFARRLSPFHHEHTGPARRFGEQAPGILRRTGGATALTPWPDRQRTNAGSPLGAQANGPSRS